MWGSYFVQMFVHIVALYVGAGVTRVFLTKDFSISNQLSRMEIFTKENLLSGQKLLPLQFS